LVLENAKADMHQLAHTCAKCGHFRLSFCQQTLVERLDIGVITGGHNRRHIEFGADSGVARFGQARSAFNAGAGLVFDWHHAQISSGLRRILEAPGLQNGEQQGGNNRAYALDGLKQPPVAAEVWMRLDMRFQCLLKDLAFGFKVLNHAPDGLDDQRFATGSLLFLKAIALARRTELVEVLQVGFECLLARLQDLQLAVLWRRGLPGRRLRQHGITRQAVGISVVGFGYLP